MQGTPPAPARRRLRRAAVALIAVMPLLGAAVPAQGAPTGQSSASLSAQTAQSRQASYDSAAAPASARSPQAPSAPRGSRTTDVSVNAITPAVPEPGGTLTLEGTITNKGDATIGNAHLGLRLSSAMNSRSTLDQASRRTGFLLSADGPEIPGQTKKIKALRPGVTLDFSLTVPVDELGLGPSGVYHLGVSLTGQTKARPYPQILGIRRSFLPWQTTEAQTKTELTYMWPLISSSHLTARTESDEQQTPVFRDDELAKDIAPGGRLQQLVALGSKLPITWVVDPDLLASVDAMTGPYEVRTEDDKTTPGKGQEQAKQWLNSLQEAVEGEEIIALPFADPDLASLAHRGREVGGTLSRLRPATELAVDTVETILHMTPNTDFAWPAEGAVDSSVVQVATSGGAHNVIARSDSLREGGLHYTPTGARPIGGGTTAVVADHGLSTAFSGDMSRAGAATQAVQRFLSETLTITQQVPNQQRSLVVAPQRMPTVSQAQAMADALQSLSGGDRWTTALSLPKAAKAKPDPSAKRSVPGPGSYPGRLRKQELPAEAFLDVQETQGLLGDFRKILTQEDKVVTPFGNAIDREVSNSWRGRPDEAARFRNSVQGRLKGLTRKVELIQKSDLTLSGRSATIPVTVQNNLLQGVNGLELRLKSSRSIGLEVQDGQPVAVDGGHSQSVKFETTAKANGRTTVTAQLFTADDKPYGPPMDFQVKVTSITSTVLLVIAGGVLLVVLAGIRMYTQRRRRGPAQDPEAPLDPDAPLDDASEEEEDEDESGEGTDEGTDEGTADAGQPGERRPDTTAESGGPQDTGEKVDR
ncbi:DUF6049 family protein [Streptomyces sp. N2-109]|uniref:DUF6049 family protein n=1 Tax=Streptomyces gossypii TaxID=2883101 RepID=A0ABT2JN28_9ACTN|nr:DUF6049 family protein [Streptomyces gossypii]MCT2589231.1 DUF6049 family protein [Streptomyces gossypii]